MAGNTYMDGLWVSQGDPALVCEQQTADPYTIPSVAGAVRQFISGQLGKRIALPNPTNAASLLPNIYQYVKRNSAAAMNQPGYLLTWNSPTLFEVRVSRAGIPAGVFLGDDNAAVGSRGMSNGCHGFIQVGGIVDIVIQPASGAAFSAGDPVFISAATDGTVTSSAVGGVRLVGYAVTGVTETGAGEKVSTLLDLPPLINA